MASTGAQSTLLCFSVLSPSVSVSVGHTHTAWTLCQPSTYAPPAPSFSMNLSFMHSPGLDDSHFSIWSGPHPVQDTFLREKLHGGVGRYDI